MAKDNLIKIVTELIDNAVKFSKPGTPIKVRFTRDQEDYVLQIRDYGRGMSRSELDQVGAFMQFNREAYEQQGLGLGLIIAQRLVELHLGKMEITSKQGEGTLVRIQFRS